ncbi:NAD(P)-binding protein [Auricularia subglabra TFB-10046 SS5]|nr:NAD(P)-binding protein [Auricularia subglabra TFB-10046 SS5]
MSFTNRTALRKTFFIPCKRLLNTARADPSTSLPEFSLKDRVFLVTGAARGLGLTQAESILEADAPVYAVDKLLEPPPDFDQVASRAKHDLGTQIDYIQADVRDQRRLHSIAEHIVNKERRIDGLIAAAGILEVVGAMELSKQGLNETIETNLIGTFISAQAVAKQMVKLGTPGSLVLIASVAGSVASKGAPSLAYSSSKAGVLQLGRSFATEWGPYGIRVNTLSPGYIRTQMVDEALVKHPELQNLFSSLNPLGRIAVPKEFRGAAVFLLSDASSFMTGANLVMDGGHCAW